MTYLNRALLINAIRFGVTDWSIVVQKCLGLALQSALSCRAGDMAVSNTYADNECLLYKDIQLQVTVDPEASAEDPLLDRVTMQAKLTIRHTKNYMHDGSHNHIVILDSVEDPEFNVVDPLKLLVAHALRQGTFMDANSAEEVVHKAFLHPSKRVEWSFPDRLIMCLLANKRLEFDKGAGIEQSLTVPNEAGQLSGITQ